MKKKNSELSGIDFKIKLGDFGLAKETLPDSTELLESLSGLKMDENLSNLSFLNSQPEPTESPNLSPSESENTVGVGTVLVSPLFVSQNSF